MTCHESPHMRQRKRERERDGHKRGCVGRTQAGFCPRTAAGRVARGHSSPAGLHRRDSSTRSPFVTCHESPQSDGGRERDGTNNAEGSGAWPWVGQSKRGCAPGSGRLSGIVFLGRPEIFFAISISLRGDAGEQSTPFTRSFASYFSSSRRARRLTSYFAR